MAAEPVVQVKLKVQWLRRIAVQDEDGLITFSCNGVSSGSGPNAAGHSLREGGPRSQGLELAPVGLKELKTHQLIPS